MSGVLTKKDGKLQRLPRGAQTPADLRAFLRGGKFQTPKDPRKTETPEQKAAALANKAQRSKPKDIAELKAMLENDLKREDDEKSDGVVISGPGTPRVTGDFAALANIANLE